MCSVTDLLGDNLAFFTLRLVVLCLVMSDRGPSVMARLARGLACEGAVQKGGRG